MVVITEPVSKRPEPTQKRDQISSATSRRSQRKDTLSERLIWTDLRSSTGIYWYIGFDASGPDKQPLVELCSLKICCQENFSMLEIYFSQAV